MGYEGLLLAPWSILFPYILHEVIEEASIPMGWETTMRGNSLRWTKDVVRAIYNLRVDLTMTYVIDNKHYNNYFKEVTTKGG